MGNLTNSIADDFSLLESSEKELQDCRKFESVNNILKRNASSYCRNQNTYLRGWISIHIAIYIHMHVQLAINNCSKLSPIRHKYWKYYLGTGKL
jgi:hypothetical protein